MLLLKSATHFYSGSDVALELFEAPDRPVGVKGASNFFQNF